MDSNEIKSLIQGYLNAYNFFDVDGMLLYLHKDIEFRNISNGVVDVETKGINQFRQLAEQSKKIMTIVNAINRVASKTKQYAIIASAFVFLIIISDDIFRIIGNYSSL